MAKKEKMLTAVFRDRLAADRAYEWLQDMGYASSEINVLMSDRTRAFYAKEEEEGRIKTGSMAAEGAATGGAIGTAVGATLGAIAAIGMSFAVPGLGMVVAGPLLAGLAGGGAGAVTGGLIGGLVGLGVSEPNAKAYEEALRNGGVVLGVVPRTNEDGKAIQKYFEEHNADNIVYA